MEVVRWENDQTQWWIFQLATFDYWRYTRGWRIFSDRIFIDVLFALVGWQRVEPHSTNRYYPIIHSMPNCPLDFSQRDNLHSYRMCKGFSFRRCEFSISGLQEVLRWTQTPQVGVFTVIHHKPRQGPPKIAKLVEWTKLMLDVWYTELVKWVIKQLTHNLGTGLPANFRYCPIIWYYIPF
jgi:hypothetical protein